MNIKDEIIDTARQMGIDKIGFTTRERLSDAPLSADFGYVLPEARSAWQSGYGNRGYVKKKGLRSRVSHTKHRVQAK
jgi:hypothetical protein